MSYLPLLSAPPADRNHVAPPPAFFACPWSAAGPDASWVHVSGELDLATTPHLELTLHDRLLQSRLVVLDLRELFFMDSSGVHAVIDASLKARAIGSRLIIVRGPRDVDRMFTLTATTTDVEVIDIDAMAPPVQVLRALAEAEGARLQV